MSNNVLFMFIKEMIQRWGQKSPWIFKVISWISAITAAVAGLPGLLQMFNIVLPAPFDALANKTVAISAVVALFISGLTVKDAQAIAADPTNNKLALTAKKDVGLDTPPKKD